MTVFVHSIFISICFGHEIPTKFQEIDYFIPNIFILYIEMKCRFKVIMYTKDTLVFMSRRRAQVDVVKVSQIYH